MIPRLSSTTLFDRRAHRVEGFRCGQKTLDRWLLAYAGQSQHRDPARTFVTVETDGDVAGYYTLVAAQVEYERTTARFGRELSGPMPMPVLLIARLAVATSHQGAGLGRSLLLDVLQRVLRASEGFAVRAVTADAFDEHASSFYRAFGFEPSDLEPNTLMIPLHRVRHALGRDTA